MLLVAMVARVTGQRRQWHPTPVLLPGKSHGWRSLVGCSPWGGRELDTRHRGDGAGLEVRGSALPLRRVGRPTCKVRGFKRVAFAGLGAPDLVVPSSPLSRAPLRAQEPGRHHLSLRVLVLCLANVLVAPKWSDTGAKGSGCVCPQESGWTLRGEEPAPEQAQAAPGALAFQFSAGGVGLAAPGLLGRS